jgi:hypothetical protein
MRFIHFAEAWLKSRWWKIRGYRATVPAKIANRRFSECEACEHFEDGECLLCGCLAQAKVIMASESCPRGLWPSVKISSDKKAP